MFIFKVQNYAFDWFRPFTLTVIIGMAEFKINLLLFVFQLSHLFEPFSSCLEKNIFYNPVVSLLLTS